MSEHAATFAGHVLLFLTTIAGFGFQWFREGRRHKWEQEKYETLRVQIKNGHDEK